MKKPYSKLIIVSLILVMLQSMFITVFADDPSSIQFDGVERFKEYIRKEGVTANGESVYIIYPNNDEAVLVASIASDGRIMVGLNYTPSGLNGAGFSFSRTTAIAMSPTEIQWEISHMDSLSAGKTEVHDTINGHINPTELTSDYVFVVESYETSSKSTEAGDGIIKSATDAIHSIITILDEDFKEKNADFTISDLGFETYIINPDRESEILIAPVTPAPMSLSKLSMNKNSIGNTVVSAVFHNDGSKTIEGFDFYVECYDVYGDLVKGYNKYSASTCSYDQSIYPGGTSRWDWEWTLYGFDAAKTIRVAICKYKLQGEKAVEIPDSQLVWIEK